MVFLIFAVGLIIGVCLGVIIMSLLSLASREPLDALIQGPDPVPIEEPGKPYVQEVRGLGINTA